MWTSGSAEKSSGSNLQLVTVARVGKAHGLAGDVSVELRTDEPEVRLAVGAQVLLVTGAKGEGADLTGQYTVAASRFHSGRFIVRFAEVVSRNDAEAIRGMFVESEVDPQALPVEEDAYYDRQLVGLTARSIDGTDLGEVVRVDHLPGQDYLIVKGSSGDETMVPFVIEIVPDVDLEQSTVTMDPPEGLFGEPGETD
ncbi:MAG: ribosome maturation factor RimM [Candidatus Nanopelagicales bacterium]